MLEPRRKHPMEDGMRVWLLVGAVAVVAIAAYAELIVDLRTPTRNRHYSIRTFLVKS